MTSTIGHQALLPTKLHQPRTTADLVHRPRLKQLLDSGLDRPLILVVSLDEADDDLGSFLACLPTATQILFPVTLPPTHALLSQIALQLEEAI